MPHSARTILVADDHPLFREALKGAVGRLLPGARLVDSDTAEALFASAESHPEADLVLLDLDLPDQPGIAVLQALQADSRLRTLPVIVVSAESRPQRIDECFDAGAAQFLTKPLDGAQLLRTIDQALND